MPDPAEHFRAELTRLRNSRRFLNRSQSTQLAIELAELLHDLEHSVHDPVIGVRLMKSFFTADARFANRCDDSYGSLANVYRHNASRLFSHYASGMDDKVRLRKLLLKLVLDDDYALRERLINHASEFLPADQLTILADEILAGRNTESDSYADQTRLGLARAVARQLRDMPLFERLAHEYWQRNPPLAALDIGELYLESGDLHNALSWLQQANPNDPNMGHKVDDLLLRVHTELDNDDLAEEVARRRFRRRLSPQALDDMLQLIGHDQRHKVLTEEAEHLLAAEQHDLRHLLFMRDFGLRAAASQYLLKHAHELNGRIYEWLLPVAEFFEDGAYLLEASLVYRALLDYILAGARTPTYRHGARYLARLAHLAPRISAWSDFESHEQYFARISEQHGKKRSFWAKYDGPE